MYYKIISIFLFLIFPLSALASSAEGIPVKFVFFQVFNFSLFMILIIYLIKKYIPKILKQKKQDFLDYQTRAHKLETKYKSEYLQLEQEISILVQKQQNIKQSVELSLKRLYKELADQEIQELEYLKKQNQQEIDRQKKQALRSLKNKLLSQVIQKSKEQLKKIEDIKQEQALNYSVIKRWEQI